MKKGVLSTVRPARFQRAQVLDANPSSQSTPWTGEVEQRMEQLPRRVGLPNGVSVAFVGEVDSGSLATILNLAATLE